MQKAKSNDIEIMIANKTDEIFKQFFQSFLTRYQTGLETMKSSDFTFDSIDEMHCKCNKISLNRGGLYTDYSE